MTLRCIAIDDEPLALGLIVSFIQRTPGLELVGKFSSAIQALQFIYDNTLEIIFVDIHMPDLNGVEFARIIDQNKGANKPRIIFTTAYDNYALEGFRLDALDYLLKPFNYVDFCQSINKANQYFKLVNLFHNDSNGDDISINSENKTNSIDEPYLYLRVEYQMIKIPKNKICYIEGLKDYVKIYLENEGSPLVSLLSLKSLVEKLNPQRFMRIHRSYIVSLDKVTSVTKNSVSINDLHFKVSDAYKDDFNIFLTRWQ